MTTVAEVLSKKPRPFNYIEPNALVSDALSLLRSVNLSYLVVMHENEFKGIFSEHNYIDKIAMDGWDAHTCRVADSMRNDMPFVSLEDCIETCVQLCIAHNIHHLPVFDDFRFAGVITRGDIMRTIVDKGSAAVEKKKVERVR